MPLQVAIQMDPIERVNIDADTTFFLMLEAQARGHGLFIYAADKLALDDGRVLARGRSANLRAIKGDHHTSGEAEVRDLSEFDVVLMRQDPPFDLAYITATYFL
jgi:glutathione synthase